jgi:hypothetical protein
MRLLQQQNSDVSQLFLDGNQQHDTDFGRPEIIVFAIVSFLLIGLFACYVLFARCQKHSFSNRFFLKRRSIQQSSRVDPDMRANHEVKWDKPPTYASQMECDKTITKVDQLPAYGDIKY